MKQERAVIAVTSLALLIVSFWPAYGLYRFHDDWTFVYKAAEALRNRQVLSFIARPLDQHWSPIWQAIEVLNFLVAGWESDWFIRTLTAACTLGSLLLCASFLRTLRVSLSGQIVAVGTLALHHAAAAARFSFDTYSQSLADLVGWMAVVCVIRALLSDRGITRVTMACVLGLLVPVIFLKEQSLAAFLAVGVTMVAAATWRPDLRRSPRAFLLVGCLVVTAGLFTLARAAMGVRFAAPGEAFSFCPACVPVNVAELGAAVFMPVRTLVWFDAARAVPMDTARLVGVLVAAALVAAAIIAGNVLRARRGEPQLKALALVTLCLASSYFPVALLGHVGELYTHANLFWFAALVGCAVDGYWSRSKSVRAATIAVAAVYLVVLGVGQHANARDMRATGERSRQWLARIVERLQPVPDGSFVLIHADGEYKSLLDYGLYRLTTPQVLVLTGISPYPVRSVLHDRVTVLLDEEPERWRVPLASAIVRGAAFRLELAAGDASVSQIMKDADLRR